MFRRAWSSTIPAGQAPCSEFRKFPSRASTCRRSVARRCTGKRCACLPRTFLRTGWKTPIQVRHDGKRHILVEGLHRLEAAKWLGETTIDAYLGRRGATEAPALYLPPLSLNGRALTAGDVDCTLPEIFTSSHPCARSGTVRRRRVRHRLVGRRDGHHLLARLRIDTRQGARLRHLPGQGAPEPQRVTAAAAMESEEGDSEDHPAR